MDSLVDMNDELLIQFNHVGEPIYENRSWEDDIVFTATRTIFCFQWFIVLEPNIVNYQTIWQAKLNHAHQNFNKLADYTER